MNAVVPMLEDSLVWDESGHLAGCAVSAIADGELSLVPAAAVTHAADCAQCAERVGEAVLFALEIAEALSPTALVLANEEAVLAIPEKARPRSEPPLPAPLPVPAVIGALVLALVSGAPWLCSFGSLGSPAKLLSLLGHVLARVLQVARAPGVTELAWFAAAVLAVIGVSVAKVAARRPRPEPSR